MGVGWAGAVHLFRDVAAGTVRRDGVGHLSPGPGHPAIRAQLRRGRLLRPGF